MLKKILKKILKKLKIGVNLLNFSLISFIIILMLSAI